MCQPVQIATVANVGPYGITVDATNVYWTAKAPSQGGGVYRCSVDPATCNNQPVVVAANESGPNYLAVDSASLYWTNAIDNTNGSVRSCALPGCITPTTLASSRADFIAVDVPGIQWGPLKQATNLYWTDLASGNADGSVMRCSAGGCGGNPITLASGLNLPGKIAVDASNIYWGGGSSYSASIYQCGICATVGCCASPLVLASDQPSYINPIAVGGGVVYWANEGALSMNFVNGSVALCAVGGCGMSPTPIHTSDLAPEDIAVDATNVYWIDGGTNPSFSDGKVLSCPLAGCPAASPTMLASGQSYAKGIAVDANAVYWINAYTDGPVMKVAKP